MRAHEAGALHGDLGYREPPWLERPADINEMVEGLWSTTSEIASDGVLVCGGVRATDVAREFGTPTYVVDETDFRARASAFRDAFADYDVFYAGKAFLCTAVARWIAEADLWLDVCTDGELEVAVRAGVQPSRIGFHGNNKSEPELRRALQIGVGRIIVDSVAEIDRLVGLTAAMNVTATVMVRVTAGVEAHTHEYIATAHEDQKFGLSIVMGDAFDAVQRLLAEPRIEVLGLHSHIGSQIFDTSAFEVAARRLLALHRRVRAELGVELPELCLGGGFGIAYTTQDDPQSPQTLARSLTEIIRHESEALGVPVPRLSVEPGRAIAGPATFTLYEVGTTKLVRLDGGGDRMYVSVDGGMSDNIRTALYDADYACRVASRRSDADPILGRVVGKHCEAGDVVVKHEFVPADITAGDLLAVPGTGAYCRSMASNYNHVPRPAVVAVRDGRARLLVRRESVDDLLRLEVE
ncbi:MAG: diaminopimelate decarboxylase [Nocardioidaceae bacterium]